MELSLEIFIEMDERKERRKSFPGLGTISWHSLDLIWKPKGIN